MQLTWNQLVNGKLPKGLTFEEVSTLTVLHAMRNVDDASLLAYTILFARFGILGIQQSAKLPGERGKGLAVAGLVLGLLFILPASCGL